MFLLFQPQAVPFPVQAWLIVRSVIIQKKTQSRQNIKTVTPSLQTTLLCSVPFRFVSACDIKTDKKNIHFPKVHVCVCKQKISLRSLTYLWHCNQSEPHKLLLGAVHLKAVFLLYCHYSYFSQTFGNESLCNKYAFLNTQSQPDVRPKKFTFCHHLLTLMSFQTCMSFCLLLSTKEDILRNDW